MNYSGEDEYQKDRVKEGVKQHIYSTIYFDNIEFIVNNFIRLMNELFVDYFQYNPEMLIKMKLDLSLDKETKNQSKIENDYELWKTINANKPFVAIYNLERKRVTLLKDHRYFGGLFFMKLGCKLLNYKLVTIYKESYYPLYTEKCILYFCKYWFLQKPDFSNNMIPFVTCPEDIQRKTYELNFKKYKIKVRKQTQVFYEILKPIYDIIAPIIKRSLRILIPVAFESSRQSFNNVGGIFIDFANDTIYELEQKIADNKYQAHATNILQKFINSGKTARSDVDIVFSAGYIESNGNDFAQFTNVNVSYLSIAHYPIYILSSTSNNKCFVTVTSMTPLLRF